VVGAAICADLPGIGYPMAIIRRPAQLDLAIRIRTG
jgi:hypothetical protein